MHKQELNKTKIIFLSLSGLVLLQLAWWAYLIVSQQSQIAALSNSVSASAKAEAYSYMIISEASFVAIVWGFGVAFIWKSFQKQILLQQSQSNFVNAVTHELKTPISNIRLCLDTLKRNDLSAENKDKYLARAHKATDSLLEQIEKILILANASEKQSPLQNILIQDLIEKCLFELNMNESFEINWFNFNEDLQIQAHKLESEMILNSVLSNAKKYSHNSKKLDIGFNEHNDFYEVSIKDYGLGLNTDNNSKVFLPFWRDSQATELAIGGTGLGLSISQSLAQNTGMKLKFYSEGENQGSTLSIFWPKGKLI